MKERLITLLCALGALALFFTMFIHDDERGGGGKEVPRPTTAERGGNGYHAALVWLDAEHIRAVSLQERFDKLIQQRGLAATGNVLVVTLPATAQFRTEEFRPLDRWVRAGNTLLVLAALSDAPDWAYASGSMAAGDLNLLTGLEFETVMGRDLRARNAGQAGSRDPGSTRNTDSRGLAGIIEMGGREYAEPRHTTLVPNRPHAYFDGVREAVALSDYPAVVWTVRIPYEGFVFALGRQRETGEGVLWTRPLGSGRIVVSGFGSLFTNRALGLADNGRLLANIIGASLGTQGSVLFDDVHQGLGAAYDPARFYRDPRLHVTVGILALLWLTWVLGATKLRMPVTRTPVPREAELVRATGGFLARVLTPVAAARRMFEHFVQGLGQHGSRAGARPLADSGAWELLERHSRVAPADVRQLKAWHARLVASKRVPLTRLHNVMVRINRQLHS
jgi:hypothetical protein